MNQKFNTICAQAGHATSNNDPDVTSSIHLSTTFQYDATGEPPAGWLYSRENNPNRKHVEGLLAQLEHGVDAAAFSSGSAAAHASFLSLSPGDHVIIN